MGKVKRTTGAVELQSLDPNTCLWHVMSSTAKLETFLNGGLWFARLDQFGSPNYTLESALPQSNLELLQSKLPGVQVPEVQQQYVLGIQRAYASCWHMNGDAPSDHAWTTFGGGNGVAVRTDAKTLQCQLANITGPDGPVYIAPVKYIDHDADFIQDGNIIAAAFAIRDAFSHEQEVRALIYTHGTSANDYLCGKKGPLGCLVAWTERQGVTELTGGHLDGRAIVAKINPDAFIREVMIQPGAGRITRCRVACLLRRHGLQDRLRK
jgi:hypothetical protein